MKVKINSEFIKSNRLNRAWSQEQLAHLAGLSLRTIHRVETNGTASLESIKAIASVLEVPLEQIMQCIKAEEKSVNSRLLRNGVIASLGALLFATLSIFVGNTALAEQVMLDVNVSVNDEILGEFGNILVVESKEEVFLFEEVVKILLVTTITENDGLVDFFNLKKVTQSRTFLTLFSRIINKGLLDTIRRAIFPFDLDLLGINKKLINQCLNRLWHGCR